MSPSFLFALFSLPGAPALVQKRTKKPANRQKHVQETQGAHTPHSESRLWYIIYRTIDVFPWFCCCLFIFFYHSIIMWLYSDIWYSYVQKKQTVCVCMCLYKLKLNVTIFFCHFLFCLSVELNMRLVSPVACMKREEVEVEEKSFIKRSSTLYMLLNLNITVHYGHWTTNERTDKREGSSA